MNKIFTTISLVLITVTAFSQGFSTSATKWTLPSGGYNDGSHDHGFISTFGVPDYNNNSLGWTTMDINGDGKMDLVVTSKGDGSYAYCPGVGSSPHWDVYLNKDSAFSSTVTSWVLPSGGVTDGSNDYGFNSIFGLSSYLNNSLGWTIMDMNGDGKPDLVITSKGDGSYADCPGVGSSPHWDVYLNKGSGFSSTSTSWALPSGGKTDGSHDYGFNGITNTADYTDSSLGWSIMDINGDGKPDLVVTSKGDGSYADCPGVGSNPQWNVYLNSGSGFSTTAKNWNLPSGGKTDGSHDFGFNNISNPSDYENNSLGWSTMDINGDGKPDLVVTSKGDGTYGIGFGVGSSPHWNVYLNKGSGFSDTASAWDLPSGGKTDGATNFGFDKTFNYAEYENNSLGWSTVDIDGDGKADLVVTSKGDGTYGYGFGIGSGPHWDVYLNSGSGFASSATSWSLPSGGKTNGTDNFGFNALSDGTYTDSNSLGWSTMDINGDGKSDLVITSKGDGTNGDGFGVGSSPHWNVYLNTSITSGIETNVDKSIDLQVYPIPFADNIIVKSNENLSGKNFRIYDNMGRLALSGKIHDVNGTINVSTLTKGIYFLQVGEQSGKACKLIKE